MAAPAPPAPAPPALPPAPAPLAAPPTPAPAAPAPLAAPAPPVPPAPAHWHSTGSTTRYSLAGGAPHTLQAPPAGLLSAPCSCYFEPRAFCYEWTDMPPPSTSTLGHGTAALSGAALGGPGGWAAPGTPQGQMQQLAPPKDQQRAVATTPPVLPTNIPGYGHIEGPAAPSNISGTATSAAAPMGSSHIPPGSDIPPSPTADPRNQGLEDMAEDLAMSQEVPLKEALRLFGCSMDDLGVSQDNHSSSPTPVGPGDTGTAIPRCDMTWLSLPQEMLSPDYSVPETADAILSLEDFVMGLEAQEPWGDVGMEPPPSQPAVPEKRGWKRGQSTLSPPPSKRRALAASPGGPGGSR
ncbi:unnamed protein product, partial [Bubo scandiacus]